VSARPVAVVGLGVMGSALCASLTAAGLDVVGFDVDRGRLQSARRAGITLAGSAAAASRLADIVVTSLPGAAALLAVVADIATTRRAVVVLETSTLSLATKREAQGLLADAGGTLLDCPLSGTGEQARRGDLVAYLSGDDETAKAAVGPVLAAIGRGQHDLGAFGNGTRVKLVANLLVAVHNVAAAEALLLAEHLGLDVGTVLAAVTDGAGTSRMLEVRGPLMVDGRYEPATMRLDTFMKDLDIIANVVREAGTCTPLFDAAAALYAVGMSQDRQAQDTACVHAVLASRARDEERIPAPG
jgi:putative dehydrogenase